MPIKIGTQPARFAMTKRKAPGTPAAKQKAAKKGDSGLPPIQPDAMRLPHLKLFNTWACLDPIPVWSFSDYTSSSKWTTLLLFVIKTLPWLGKTPSPCRKDHGYFPRWGLGQEGHTATSTLIQLLICFPEDDALEFFGWIDHLWGPKLQAQVSQILLNFCLLRSYATPGDMMGEQVPLCIRPWQLPHRRDFGLRGTGDSDPTLVIPGIQIPNES